MEMKWILTAAILLMPSYVSAVSAQQLDKKWQSNKNCEACHQEISRKWETSRHSNSHFSKNDLFKKSLEFIVRKNPTLILDEVKVECAKCHNPRLAKAEVSDEEKVALLFDDKDAKKDFHQMLNNKTMKNGINCIVCHNVDKIHLDKRVGSQGMNSITFGPQGTMFGPFDDAVSPYHKTAQRPHFVGDKPTLCFACHYSAKNEHGVEVYATGEEYDTFKKREEGCKDCHMSKKKKGYASNFAYTGKKPKERMVRKHRFASVDNSNIMNDYLDMKGTVDDNYFIIKLTNHAPHKIPTGYGLREVILRVVFLDKNDKPIKTNEYILGSKWVDEKGSPTIPHLAVKRVKDTRMNGKSTNAYKFPIPKGAVYAKYSLSYRLISDGLAKEIGVTDPFFLREYTFAQMRIHL